MGMNANAKAKDDAVMKTQIIQSIDAEGKIINGMLVISPSDQIDLKATVDMLEASGDVYSVKIERIGPHAEGKAEPKA